MWTPIQLIFRKRKQETKRFKNRGKALRWFRMVFYQKEVTCHCCSVAKSCLTLCNLMDYSTPGFPVLHCLLEFAQTHGHWISDAIQPPHPLLPPSRLALNLSQHQGLFQWAGSLHQVAKYWSFSFSISPSNEYSGLISFTINFFDLFAVHRTLKSLQHHNLKASVLRCLAFFMVQLLHLYLTIGKTIALTIETFVGEVMSLLLNALSRFVIALLPRNSIF